jgi:hypothetical protein
VSFPALGGQRRPPLLMLITQQSRRPSGRLVLNALSEHEAGDGSGNAGNGVNAVRYETTDGIKVRPLRQYNNVIWPGYHVNILYTRQLRQCLSYFPGRAYPGLNKNIRLCAHHPHPRPGRQCNCEVSLDQHGSSCQPEDLHISHQVASSFDFHPIHFPHFVQLQSLLNIACGEHAELILQQTSRPLNQYLTTTCLLPLRLAAAQG